MTNLEIAAVFHQIADRLERGSDNPFRIRAYRKAAQAVERSQIPLAELSDQGQLRKVLGIGRDLEQKILELLKTGKIADEIEKPSDAIVAAAAPFALPGLDPKLAQMLHRRFHIDTLHDLERLARSHLLRTVPGLGSELEKSLLKEFDKRKESPMES